MKINEGDRKFRHLKTEWETWSELSLLDFSLIHKPFKRNSWGYKVTKHNWWKLSKNLEETLNPRKD